MTEARVVVVDDSVDTAEALACLLTFDGYSVRIAHDGAQAVALIELFEPHGVLFDINMPIMDGNELSKRLRERFGDDVVLVAITGEDGSDSRVAAAFGRVDHYLRKPVEQNELRKVFPPNLTLAAER